SRAPRHRTHEVKYRTYRRLLTDIRCATVCLSMTLPELARELKTTDRTLRRAVELGTLRAARPSPRKVVLSVAERAYLRRHWGLLSALREALRTEPAVSM